MSMSDLSISDLSAQSAPRVATSNTTPATYRVVVMGVSGCGKSTVGEMLAATLGGEFVDGDALHPEQNIAKMAAGIPLNDDDREPWLREVGSRLGAAAAAPSTLVIGCSALKHSYRDLIRAGAPDTVFVLLHGTRELLLSRVQGRADHFMPTSLLDSQLDTLELLGTSEVGREFNIAEPPATLAEQSAAWITSLAR